MKKVFRVYQSLLKSRPFLMNSLSTSMMMSTSDILAQNLDRNGDYDGKRTARMAAFGLIIGPIVLKWYFFLEDKIGSSQTIKKSLQKMAVDQIFFAPLGNLFGIATISIIEGRNPKEEIKLKYCGLLLASYSVWPLVQLINFVLIPLYFRTVFVQLIACAWNTFFLCKVHRQ